MCFAVTIPIKSFFIVDGAILIKCFFIVDGAIPIKAFLLWME